VSAAAGSLPPARPGHAARRGVVVAFSGLDGAGKSSQAQRLRGALAARGVESAVHWLPLGHSGLQRWLRSAAVRIASSARTRADSRTPAAAAPFAGTRQGRAIRERSGLVTHAWTGVVAVIYAVTYRIAVARHARRGRILIFDRYTVDAAAQLRYFQGSRRDFRFQLWILRALAPPPARAYLLDVDPSIALARKAEQYGLEQLSVQAELLRAEAERFGATRLDGDRDPDELADQILNEVWSVR
jgi:thymidylate kinase